MTCVQGHARGDIFPIGLVGWGLWSAWYTKHTIILIRFASPLQFLHQLKGTYLVIYGKWPTFFFTVGTVSVGVVSSYLAGLHWMLWPLQAFMLTVST